MKFSEQWLREWVNPPLSTEQLSTQLTMAGLEVDAIEAVAGEFTHVVVAEVLKVEPHPDADKLRVCQVNIGKTESVTIVCGAANVRQGLRVPAALIGAQLPGDLKIKKSKLRGVESHGMLCSAKELGVAEQAEGLLELPLDAPVGQDIRAYLKFDDVSIELGLTPNRSDCLSVLGIAREVAALNKLELKRPEIKPVSVTSKDVLPVMLEAKADCPRYAGRIIRGINPAAETPIWMQEHLRRSGLRSLGPVVDVTNYILLELGQPMHAFDLQKISDRIMVRHARKGEQIKLLDGQTIALSEGTLVITDAKQVLAMAGVMGGDSSAVSDVTRDIFLESAFFSPLAIAGRARSYGLHTDSSHRFERGVDPVLQVQALERASALLLEIIGGKAGPVVEVAESTLLPLRSPITLHPSRIEKVLGIAMSPEQVEDILSRLGMNLVVVGQDWQVTPPSHRFDMSIEEDLIEELGRVYGYNQLPNTRPQGQMRIGARPESRLNPRQLRRLLVDRGYQEAITYSFVSEDLQAKLDPEHTPVALANPISAELSMMRTSLWPGLVQALQYNLNRQQSRVALFEVGLRFIKADSGLRQEKVVAGVVTGSRYPKQWGLPATMVDFHDLKGDVEAVLAMTAEAQAYTFSAKPHPVLHPGQSALISHEKKGDVGWVGALHPGLIKELGLSQQVYLFELPLSAMATTRVPAFEPLSRFPAIRRDLAIVVDRTISALNVQETIKKSAPGTLTNLELFDIYTGEGIDSGRKSLALGLTFQDLSRTLTDNDIETAMGRILGVLKSELKATLRE